MICKSVLIYIQLIRTWLHCVAGISRNVLEKDESDMMNVMKHVLVEDLLPLV